MKDLKSTLEFVCKAISEAETVAAVERHGSRAAALEAVAGEIVSRCQEALNDGLPFRSECMCICHEDESVSHIAPCCQPNPVGFIDLDIAPCGNGIYWADLAKQLATVWWEVSKVGGTLQHGDLDNAGTMFSIVLEQHGGQCFHGQTPMDAWKKAHKWLVSPRRTTEEPSQVAIEIAARVWCDQEMGKIVMDSDAALEIAKIIDRVRDNQSSLSWAAQCDTLLTKLQSVIDSMQKRTHKEKFAIAERLNKMGVELAKMELTNYEP